jgi:hypothetical protein
MGRYFAMKSHPLARAIMPRPLETSNTTQQVDAEEDRRRRMVSLPALGNAWTMLLLLFLALLPSWVQLSAAPTALGTTNLVEGPAAGADSVVLAWSGSTNWTAQANDSWLHLNATNQSGTTSTTVIYTFDANTGATRTGTLTIGGLSVNVTQAGEGYSAPEFTAIIPLHLSSKISAYNSAINSEGDLYAWLDDGNLWKFSTEDHLGQIVAQAPTIEQLAYLAADSTGNIYGWSYSTDSLNRWTAPDGSLTNYHLAGLDYPGGLAIDTYGSLYLSDPGSSTIKKWNPKSGKLTNLISSNIIHPSGIAVDIAGNVYFTEENGRIKQWTPDQNLVSILSTFPGARGPISVDGSGNVYFTGLETKYYVEVVIYILSAIDGSITCIGGSGVTKEFSYSSISVDSSSNIYAGIATYSLIQYSRIVAPNANPRPEPPAAGVDSLPPILPLSINYWTNYPISDQPWLTITGFTNGVISFAFTANTSGTNRTGNITLLAKTFPITQTAAPAVELIAISPKWLPDGSLRLNFTGKPGTTYSVWSSTNLTLPLSAWTAAGMATTDAPDQFQFMVNPPSEPIGFYRVTSP